MEIRPIHRLPGRLRVGYDRRRYPIRQATLAQTLLLSQEGILDVTLNGVRGSMLVRYNPAALSEREVLALFLALGPKYLEDADLLESLGAVEPHRSLLAELLGQTLRHVVRSLIMPPLIGRVLTWINVAPRVVRGAGKVLSGHPFTSETLDTAALCAALLSGDTRTASSVSLLLKMGETLEDFTRQASYGNLARALLAADEAATVLDDEGQERRVPVGALRVGDRVIVRAGACIPADGEVLSGEGMVGQAGITGEPLPVFRSAGHTVFAGTTVEEGELILRVKALGRDTKIQGILALIEDSAAYKAGAQRRAELLADRLVPFNFALAALTWLVTRNPARAAATLMVDYSCAMKLAAPVTVLAAMRQCAVAGIAVKGGRCLEAAAEADTLLVDKTGTLTASTPRLCAVIPFHGRTEDDILRLAACLEEHFPHPLARAVVEAALQRDLHHRERHARVENVVAHGIASSLDGERLLIGSAHFIFEDSGIPRTQEAVREAKALAAQGASVLYLAQGGELVGLLAVDDPIREETPAALAALRRAGFRRIVMLTGDGEPAAQAVASRLGLDGVRAQLLPEDKLSAVRAERHAGHCVAMVGDGINDAPALAEADVGVAVAGCSGVAGQTADVVLPDGGIAPLAEVRLTGQRMLRRISHNNAAILGVNSLLLLGQRSGRLPGPTAAFLHNFSTVCVTLGAMRRL